MVGALDLEARPGGAAGDVMDDEELRGRLDRIEHKVDWIGETFIRALRSQACLVRRRFGPREYGGVGSGRLPISIGVVAVGSLIMQRELNRLDRRQ